MAHFAEIDSNGIVLRVLVACNKDIANNGGEQSEQAAEYFGKTVGYSSNGVKWIQTSYNNNFRKQFAAIGDFYDSIKDKFIKPPQYPSWILNENDDWQAPVPFPTIIFTNKIIGGEENNPENPVEYQRYKTRWDENILKWIGNDENNDLVSWNSSTLSWEKQ